MNKIIKFIAPYAKRYKGNIALFLILNILAWGISIIIPYITGNYIDNLVFVKTKEFVYIFSAVVLGINVLNLVLRFILDLTTTKLNSNIAFLISYDVYEHLRCVSIREFENRDSVYLSNRITNDCSNITYFCMNNLISVFTNGGTLIAALIILLHIYIPIALLLLILLPIYIVLYLFFRKPLFQTNTTFREKQDEYLGVVSEQFQNIHYIKVNVLFQEVSKRLKTAYSTVYKFLYKYYKLNYIFSNLGTTIIIIANVILAFVGGLAVVNGHITIGMYSIVNIYFNMIVNSISFFLSLATSLQEANTSYSRLQELYSIAPEHNGETIISDINEIRVTGLSFCYNENRTFYNGSDLMFEKGNIYCFVGENGAGKSTLANLVVGLYMGGYEGTISFDDKDISEIDLYNARKQLISVSTQEPVLMNNTIYENIVLGVENANEQSIIEWCKALNIYDTIQKMPDGIHTKLSEKSANISGGEKQKFTHIRSFMKRPRLLILDEPTSALDKHSTEVFKQILEEQKKDKIIIVITHDQALNNIADYVVSFNDGKVTSAKL